MAETVKKHPKHHYKISPTTGARLPSKRACRKKIEKLEADLVLWKTLLQEHLLP